MEWRGDLKAGVETLDKQHRKLIDMSSGLVAAIKGQVCKYAIRHILMSLEETIAIHFSAEENFMQLYNYPEYLQHKAEHERFGDDVLNLKRDLIAFAPDKKCRSYELSVEANQVIVDFMIHHIEQADRLRCELFSVYPLNRHIYSSGYDTQFNIPLILP